MCLMIHNGGIATATLHQHDLLRSAPRHRLQDLRLRFDQAGEERQRFAEEHVRTQQMLDAERQERAENAAKIHGKLLTCGEYSKFEK